MNENKNLNIKIKKILITIFLSILLFCTLIGACFGFKNSIENSGKIDNNFNDYVQIQTDVEILDSSKNVKDATKSVLDTLNFLGIQNVNIDSVNNNHLIITTPIDSYVDSDNEKSSIEMSKNSTNNKNYLKEVENIIFPLFFSGTLDFRTTKGNPIFVYDSVNSIEYWKFDEDTINTDNAVEDTSETATTSWKNDKSIDWDSGYDLKNFYEKANLKYENGLPYIEIEIKKEGNNGDGYLKIFQDFDNWITSNLNSSTISTDYVIWFNFDLIYELLSTFNSSDVSSESDVWTYVSSNENLRPLYLTYNNVNIMGSSKYDDKIEIRGDFTEKQAKYFVNKINNSMNYNYENIEINLIFNDDSKIMIYLMLVILMLFIIGVMFTFVIYFGLLGFIASIVFLMINVLFSLLFSKTGIVVTGLGLSSILFVALFSALILYLIVNQYKNFNKDKISTILRAKQKWSKINSLLLVPIISFVLIIYFAGILLGTTISVPLNLIVIGVVFDYLIGILVMFPIIFLVDYLINFSNDSYDSKWNFIIGFNFKIENKINTEVKDIKQKTLASILMGIIILFITLITGGIYFIYFGSVINTNFYGTNDYLYGVQLVESNLEMLTSENSFGTYNSSYSEIFYDQTMEYEDQIITIFEDNDIKVSTINSIRNDSVNVPEESESIELISNYGFLISSKDKMSAETIESISNSLSIVEVRLGDDTMYETTSFELSNNYSLSNSNEAIEINSFTENNWLFIGIISILIIILIITVISLFVGNWGIAIATFISTLLEAIFIFGPTLILFIPFASILFYPLILFISISGVLKIFIIKNVKKDEVIEKKWIRNCKQQMFVIPTLALFMFIISLMLIGIYGIISVISLIFISIISPLFIFWIQQFNFPFLAEMFGNYRDRVKENKLNDDIRKSTEKDTDKISEEYIKGVNM